MYCTKCGSERPEGLSVCPNCGAVAQQFSSGQPYSTPQFSAGPGMAPMAAPPNYLVQSILVTLCCCLPAGIVSIVYAAQVNSKLAAGDFAGAQAASRNAKLWSWVGFGCGVAVAVIYAIFVGIAMVSGSR